MFVKIVVFLTLNLSKNDHGILYNTENHYYKNINRVKAEKYNIFAFLLPFFRRFYEKAAAFKCRSGLKNRRFNVQRAAQSASTKIDLPALWALNCGAYWHWMVAMPEVNSPGLVTQTS